MSRIREISLKNFQSHERTLFELSPGINVIAGQSDSGKTAVIRALKWLAFNRPRGGGFCSHWASDKDETIAEVILDTGVPVAIVRKKGSNRYYLGGIGGEGFKALGTEIPDEIKESLNLSEINFQSQMDPPFLVSETSGEVSRHFNSIAHLDDIDRGTTNVNRRISQIRHSVESGEERVKELEKDYESYSFLDGMEEEFEKVENLQKESRSIRENYGSIKQCVLEITKAESEMEEKLSPYLVISDSVKRACEIVDLRFPLNSALSQVEEVESNLELLSNYEGLTEKVEKSLLYKQNVSALNSFLSDFEKAESDLAGFKSKNKKLCRKWESEFKGKPCPLCGSVQKGE